MKPFAWSVLAISVACAGAVVRGQSAGQTARRSAPRAAAKAPTSATYITKEQVDAVNKTPGTDRQLKVVDLGDLQFAVGIIHRGPTGTGARGAATAPPAAAAATPRRSTAAGADAAPGQPCGAQGTLPADATGGGIAHDATTEGYYITSGAGTLVTGGHIMNGRRSGPESEVTQVLNGPSCSGAIAGTDVITRAVKAGDIIIIPAGVPHGWTLIADHVDYLSFRPDPKKVLAHDYTNPAMPK
jgi:hypothetical protein